MFTNGAEQGTGRHDQRRRASNRERPLRADGGSTTAGHEVDVERATPQGDDVGHDATDRRLDERLRAVERALTGTDRPVADLESSASAAEERERLDERLCDLETRIEELEAATQAVRGYVGAIRAVNREVERRAALALAAATEARAATTEAAETVEDERPAGDGPSTTGAQTGGSAAMKGRDRDPLDDPAIAAAIPETTSGDEDRVMDEGRGDDRSVGAATLERLREVI